jgi:hypothetical protein
MVRILPLDHNLIDDFNLVASGNAPKNPPIKSAISGLHMGARGLLQIGCRIGME